MTGESSTEIDMRCWRYSQVFSARKWLDLEQFWTRSRVIIRREDISLLREETVHKEMNFILDYVSKLIKIEVIYICET